MEVLNSNYDGRTHITSINPNLHVGIGSDLVDHANRLGIKLKSAGRVRQSQTTIGRRLSARRVATAVENCRTWDVMNDWASPPPQAFVQNVIIPLTGQSVTDEENLRHSISRQSLSGGATNRAPLPHMRHGSATHSQRSTSTYLDKYVSSTPSEFFKDNRGRKKSSWNSSGQALRFQHEQENKDKSRILQRTAVIQPHRLDRMYYISGTQVPLDGKYDVDNEEMLKLKDMSKVRREAAHYGRGLSERRNLIGNAGNDDIQVPQNPPNSQMDHVPDIGRMVSPGALERAKMTTDITAQAKSNPTVDPLEGLTLKGVSLEGGHKSNEVSNTLTVHVVNEDNLRTPDNSARTEQTNGNNSIALDQLKQQEMFGAKYTKPVLIDSKAKVVSNSVHPKERNNEKLTNNIDDDKLESLSEPLGKVSFGENPKVNYTDNVLEEDRAEICVNGDNSIVNDHKVNSNDVSGYNNINTCADGEVSAVQTIQDSKNVENITPDSRPVDINQELTIQPSTTSASEPKSEYVEIPQSAANNVDSIEITEPAEDSERLSENEGKSK